MTKKGILYVSLYLALIIIATLLLGSKKIFENKLSLILFSSMTLGIIININSYFEKLEIYLSFGLTRKQIFNNIYKNILIILILSFLGIVTNIIIKAVVFKNIDLIDELLRLYENGSLYIFIVSIHLFLMIMFKNKYLGLISFAVAAVMFIFDVMNFMPWLGVILIALTISLYFFNKFYLMKNKI